MVFPNENNKEIKFYQRVILMIMLVFMPVYSVGSDFFLEGFPNAPIEIIENGELDMLDFDDHASLRTVRQEQVSFQQVVLDLIVDKISIIDANCNDQICVNQGPISNTITPIICLPHKIIIKIESDSKLSEIDSISQ